MATDTTVQASAVDMLLACASSVIEPDDRIDTAGYPAAVGNAAHDAAEECIVHGVNPPISDLSIRAAQYHDVKPSDVEPLVWLSLQAVEAIKESFNGSKKEVTIPSKLFRVRVDIIRSLVGAKGTHSISILDLKTGRVITPNPGQMLAGAAAAYELYGMPATGYIYTGEIWCRHGEVIERRVDENRIKGFITRVKKQLARAGKSYNPGPHCARCKRLHECKPREAHIKTACAVMVMANLDTVTRDGIGKLYDKRCELKKALAEFDGLLDVFLADGPIPIGDGRQLELVGKKIETLDPLLAWGVLQDVMTDEEIASILTMAKTRALDIVAGKAPKRKGKAARTELLSRLREAGAIITSVRNEKKVVTK